MPNATPTFTRSFLKTPLTLGQVLEEARGIRLAVRDVKKGICLVENCIGIWWADAQLLIGEEVDIPDGADLFARRRTLAFVERQIHEAQGFASFGTLKYG